MKPLPSIAQAYSLLIQDEKQREVHSSPTFVSESVSMNAKSGIKSIQENIICNNCKKASHVASKCYRLIGFPKDFKFTKGKSVASHATSQSNEDDDATVQSNSNQIQEISNNQFQQLVSMIINLNSKHSQTSDASNFTYQKASTVNFAGKASHPSDASNTSIFQKEKNRYHFLLTASN